ncbi:uncharacterized protein BDZ99DRAFT_359415, partial [Mytilinidion resinicola]
ISPYNAINSTTTTIILLCSAHAGNINNKLFPILVSITATTRLSPAIIIAIAS